MYAQADAVQIDGKFWDTQYGARYIQKQGQTVHIQCRCTERKKYYKLIRD